MMKKQFDTIDEYIQTFPNDVQRILEKIRQTIKKAAQMQLKQSATKCLRSN